MVETLKEQRYVSSETFEERMKELEERMKKQEARFLEIKHVVKVQNSRVRLR